MNKFKTIYMSALLGALSLVPAETSAQKIELDAPPLLWEEPREENKYDNKEYWKRKYGLRPKARPESGEVKDKDAQSAEQKDDDDGFSAPKMDKMGDAQKGAKPSDEDNAQDKEASKKDGSPSVVVDQVIPECNFGWALGQKVEDIDFDSFGERPVRVVYRGQQLTKDINLERVNLKIGANGKVTKIACF